MAPSKTTLIFLFLLLAGFSAAFAQSGLIYTVSGGTYAGFSGDGGPASAALLSSPQGTAIDAAGNIYIADGGNCRIRKIDAGTGIIHTIAGKDSCGFSGDGGPATNAKLNFPDEVVLDNAGNIYVNDGMFNFRIRKIDTAGNISTVAGDPAGGLFSEGMPAIHAWIGAPGAIAVDNIGNLYIATWCAIFKVSPTGSMTTFASQLDSCGYWGDGIPATNAKMLAVTGMIVDASGNLYLSDWQNRRIRMVNTSGIITTFAGTGVLGHTGDGGPATAATIGLPGGFAIDAGGNILYVEYGYHSIRKISTGGIISKIAGIDSIIGGCYEGEGTLADTSCIYPGYHLAVDHTTGWIYFCNGNRYSVIKPVPTGTPQFDQKRSVILSPNPAYDELTIGTPEGEYTSYDIIDLWGRSLIHQPITGAKTDINVRALTPGFYSIRLVGRDGAIARQFFKQ